MTASAVASGCWPWSLAMQALSLFSVPKRTEGQGLTTEILRERSL